MLMKKMDRPLSICTSPRMLVPGIQIQMIEEFWRNRKEEIEMMEDFGEHAIPTTRLKKVIGAEKGNMMTFDTPSFLAKLCEIFVQEISFRAWMCASSHHRSIILDTDIAEAIDTTESYNFLKDILHAFWEKHNAIPSSKLTKKRHRSTNQSSTSHHSTLNQGSQFHPQFGQYPPIVRIPHPSLLTNVHPMALPFPFPFPLQQVAPLLMSTIVTPTPFVAPAVVPPINYMATSMESFGNGINTTVPSNFVVSNYIVASGVMNHPLEVRAGATSNIPSTSFYMNMTSPSVVAYDVGDASNSNIAAASGQHIAMEQDHILPDEVAETASMMQAYATTDAIDDIEAHQEQQIDLDGGQQEQHQVDGTLDVVVASASATNVGGDNYDVSWDEIVIPDDSFISTFWEDILMEDNPAAPLPDSTSSAGLLISNTQDLEGPRDGANVFADLSPTQRQAVAGSPNTPV